MESIDQIRIHFDPGQLLLINICLGFLMFSIALDLRVQDFLLVFKSPKTVAAGLTSQLLLLPVFTIGLIYFWDPPPSVALGLGLIAACPGGNISNYTVHLARGNTALSVCLTTIVTISAIFTTPIIFAIIAQIFPDTRALLAIIELSYYDLAKTILILIWLPLCIGMSLNHYLGERLHDVKSVVKKLALFIFVSVIAAAVLSNLDTIRHDLYHVFWIVIVHNLAAIGIGYLYSAFLGLAVEERKTIAIETGIQNSGLGLVIIFNYFSTLGGMMLVAAWWGIWDMISAFILGLWWRQGGPKPEEKENFLTFCQKNHNNL